MGFVSKEEKGLRANRNDHRIRPKIRHRFCNICVCCESLSLFFIFHNDIYSPEAKWVRCGVVGAEEKKNNNSQKNKVIAQRVQLPIPVTKSFPKNILNWLEWERLWPYNTEEKRNEEK